MNSLYKTNILIMMDVNKITIQLTYQLQPYKKLNTYLKDKILV